MDEFDCRKIDKWITRQMGFDNDAGEWLDDDMEGEEIYTLIAIGQYNGIDLPDTIIDQNYIVWQVIPTQDCKVIL